MIERVDVRLPAGRGFVTGWTSVSIFRTVEACAGTFSLEVPAGAPNLLGRNAEIEILAGSTPVLSGFVDKLSARVAAQGRTVTISGRDRTADLADCSIDLPSGELYGLTFAQVLALVTAPYGLTVNVDRAIAAGDVVERFAWGPTDSAWEALERLLRARGLLGFPDASGALTIALPRSNLRPVDTLEVGRQVLELTLEADDARRFARYAVRGQAFASDLADVAGAYQAIAEARDAGARRGRFLAVTAESSASLDQCLARAQWEAATRAARASVATATVQGWRNSTGAVWSLLDVVHLRANELGLDAPFVVAAVRLELDAQGSRSILGLARPDAYLRQPDLPADLLGDAFGSDLEDG